LKTKLYLHNVKGAFMLTKMEFYDQLLFAMVKEFITIVDLRVQSPISHFFPQESVRP